MARGFESKDVEFQQEEASRRRETGPRQTREELVDRRRIDTLRLALTNARNQLDAATHPRHRELIQRTVDALVIQLGPDGDAESGG
jgi:hypothetical protein